jgi:hypothetical protein
MEIRFIVLIVTAAALSYSQQPVDIRIPPSDQIDLLQQKAIDASLKYDEARKNIENNLFSQPYSKIHDQLALIGRRLDEKTQARKEHYSALSAQMAHESAAARNLANNFDRASMSLERDDLKQQVKMLDAEEDSIKRQIESYRNAAPSRESGRLIDELEQRKNALKDLKEIVLKQQSSLSEILSAPDSIASLRGELQTLYDKRRDEYEKLRTAADSERDLLSKYYKYLDAAALARASAIATTSPHPGPSQPPVKEGPSDPSPPQFPQKPGPEIGLPFLPPGSWDLAPRSNAFQNASLTIPDASAQDQKPFLTFTRREHGAAKKVGWIDTRADGNHWTPVSKGSGDVEMIVLIRQEADGLLACELYPNPKPPNASPLYQFFLKAKPAPKAKKPK